MIDATSMESGLEHDSLVGRGRQTVDEPSKIPYCILATFGAISVVALIVFTAYPQLIGTNVRFNPMALCSLSVVIIYAVALSAYALRNTSFNCCLTHVCARYFGESESRAGAYTEKSRKAKIYILTAGVVLSAVAGLFMGLPSLIQETSAINPLSMTTLSIGVTLLAIATYSHIKDKEWFTNLVRKCTPKKKAVKAEKIEEKPISPIIEKIVTVAAFITLLPALPLFALSCGAVALVKYMKEENTKVEKTDTKRAVNCTIAAGAILTVVTAIFMGFPQLIHSSTAFSPVTITTFTWSLILFSLAMLSQRNKKGLLPAVAYISLLAATFFTYGFVDAFAPLSTAAVIYIPICSSALVGLIRTLVLANREN